MGDTLRFAEKVNLIQMEPRGELASTGFAVAKPGQEYLVLQPNDHADPFTVKLEPGTSKVEWFSIKGCQTKSGGQATIDQVGDPSFRSPFAEAGPVVLYLKQAQGV